MKQALPPFLDPARGRLNLAPLAPLAWLRRDDAFAAQMAERDRLVRERHGCVILSSDESLPAQAEALRHVLSAIEHDEDYACIANTVRRPDGAIVAVDRARPMATIARLMQQDLCILEAGHDGHVLTAAALCFPSRWILREKAGLPLQAIHKPVPVYDERYGARVQRIFDGLRVGRPVERFNGVLMESPELCQPLAAPPRDGVWLREERQTLLRLRQTGAVLFGIHTSVTPLERIPVETRRILLAAHGAQPAAVAEYHGGQAAHERIGRRLARSVNSPD